MADIFGTMDKVQSHDEDSQGSGSGSGYSDISALENETDEFGRRLLQHQRDTARLKALSGSQQAFRKARPNPRIADVLAREERENRLREAQDHQRPGSGGNQELEPPVTVPREWGRKARKQPDWMRKIIEPSEPSENGDAALNGRSGAIFTHKTAFTGDTNWRSNSDRPTHSEEQTPSASGQRPSTPPSSMRHMNTTLRHERHSEDHDFSSASLLTSTPVARGLPRKVDELARQEIEDRDQRGESDEMEDRQPDGMLRRSSNPMLWDQRRADDMLSLDPRSTRPATAQGTTSTGSRIPRRQRSPDKNQENVPPGDHNSNTIGDHKRSGTASLVNRTAQALSTRNTQRPAHQRNDSMSLLRKLARVSSMSPSPAGNKQKYAVEGDKKVSFDQDDPAVRAESAHSNHAASSQPGAMANENGRDTGPVRIDRDANSTEGTRNAGTNGISVDQALDEILNAHDRSPEAKTPVVTGAWVDTTLHLVDEALKGTTIPRPKDQVGKIERKPPIAVGIDLRRVNSEPGHTKSALADILRESQDQQQNYMYGESTIQSLEDIMHPDLDPTDPTLTFELDAAIKDENVDDGRPLTQEEKDRRQESLAIEGMNKHLRSARTNIKDASRGLRRVENRMDTTQDAVVLVPAVNAAKESTIVVDRPVGLGYVPCQTCGGSHHSAWYALWSEFRSCFYTRDPYYKYRIRLTSLGLFCVSWLIWYILECWLCSIYCHPRVTSRKTCNIDPKAPRFPFVIPTLLFRPFVKWGVGEDMYDWMWQALEAWWHKEVFERFITGGDPCWNVSPAICASPSTKLQPKTTIRSAFESVRSSRNEWVASATTTVARVTGSVVDAIDEAGSMWDDFEVGST